MKAILITTDGCLSVEQIRKGLPAKRKIVSGDIECITLDRDFKMQMFINEAGKLEHRPLNEMATAVFRSYFDTDDGIAGNVLICGVDNEGSSCNLTEEQIKEIKEKANA